MCFSFQRKHEIILSNIPSRYLLVQSQQWKQSTIEALEKFVKYNQS